MATNPPGDTPQGPWGRGPTLGDFAAAALDKARAFLEARNPDAAIREAERVFSQDPNGSWGYAALDLIADAYTAKGDFQTVAKIGRELLSIDPEPVEGYVHLARATLEEEDMRSCIQAIERGLERYPQSVSLIILNSIRFRVAHDYTRAITWAEQAVALAPWHPGALNTLGYALQAGERTEEAHRAFEQARMLDPVAAYSFRTQAVVAFGENRFADASAAALKALELDPEDEDCRRILFRSRVFANPLMRPFWVIQSLTRSKALALAAGLFAAMVALSFAGLGQFVLPAVAIYYLVGLFVVLLVQAIDDRKRPKKPPTLKNY